MSKVYEYANRNKIKILTQSSGYRRVESFENLPKIIERLCAPFK